MDDVTLRDLHRTAAVPVNPPYLEPPTHFATWPTMNPPVQGRPRLSLLIEPDKAREPSVSTMEHGLLNGQPQHQPDGKLSKVQTICKSLGLQLFYNMFQRVRGQRQEEEPKVAMRKNRWHATFRCVIHIIPVAAALCLVILNSSNYYIGGELAGPSGHNDQKLGALQFTAKLHELFMIASITTVLFTYIRRELAFGQGVPFGAVFASIQVNSISFLWSPEFVGVIYAEWCKRRKRSYMVMMLLVCSILCLSVGPSTANLMRPMLNDWPAGGTKFWLNGTADGLDLSSAVALASLNHCKEDTGDPSCPHGGWRDITSGLLSFWPSMSADQTMPILAYLPGKVATRELQANYRASASDTLTYPQWYGTQSTVAPFAIAEAVSFLGGLWATAAWDSSISTRFKFRSDNKFEVKTVAPLVSTVCNRYSSPTYESNLEFSCPSNQDILHSYNYTISQHTASKDLGWVSWMEPQLTWIDDPDLRNKTSSTIHALGSMPWAGNPAMVDLLCCSIDTRRLESTVSTSRWQREKITSFPELSRGAIPLAGSSYPQISIDTKWASYLTSPISGSESNIFLEMLKSVGLWNSTRPLLNSYMEVAIESILSTLMADGISRSSYNQTIIGSLTGNDESYPFASGPWASAMIPASGMAFHGINDTIFTLTSEEKAQNLNEMTFQAYDNGYAYSPAGATRKVYMIVLLIYCLLAILHLIYSITTGWTSTSWDSVPEIAALAMGSTNTNKLKNTGAGINSTVVFEEKVVIRETGGHLQFGFDDTVERMDRRVRQNVEYS